LSAISGAGALLGGDVAWGSGAHLFHDDERIAPVLAPVEDGDDVRGGSLRRPAGPS
jgi:hypothetical protein